MTCSAVLVGEHSGPISRVIRSVKYAECFSHMCGKPKTQRTRALGSRSIIQLGGGYLPFTCGLLIIYMWGDRVSLDVYRLSSEAQTS